MTNERADPPLACVVTPVYNGHPYLERTLACVQAQTYPNLVHVVVDNASTDDTPEVIARALGGRVPIFTRRNATLLRQMVNWNLAVGMTPPEARYIKLLPADDLMRNDCIERLVAVAEANTGVELVTAVDIFADRIKPHGLDPARTVFDGHEIARRLLMGKLHWIPNHHMFFRARPARLQDPFKLEEGSDSDFLFQLLLQGQMGFVKEPLLYTRYHASTITAGVAAQGGLLYRPIALLDRYGPEVMSAIEVRRQRTVQFRTILRHLTWWRAKGMTAVVKDNLARLKSLGFEPGPFDYAMALATWPLHKLRKTLREWADRRVSPRNTITESDFVADLGVRP
jgi:glycosyltransferase involved in cell wall biosynthesis